MRRAPPTRHGSVGCLIGRTIRERSATRLEPVSRTAGLVTAEEIAAAIGYLAGRDAGSTTGTALVVDGGLTTLRTRPVRDR